ncbi:hypothetical protein CA265_11780 [Sphingobacteriaceae bacterium GW460-11-11-14-LB5]|nr:hypothetical protein CA265_11780 [Sphingobacteriaceae bacterium GW460-11-11-14-LB5]
MVLMLIFSVLFSFGILPSGNTKEIKLLPPAGKAEKGKQPAGIDDGLSKISSTSVKLRKTVEIRKQLDSVLDRQRLNHRDTLFLAAKLEELKRLR